MSAASPFTSDLPLHVLFPEDYRKSAKMIVKDFAFFGGTMTLAIIGLATLLQGT